MKVFNVFVQLYFVSFSLSWSHLKTKPPAEYVMDDLRNYYFTKLMQFLYQEVWLMDILEHHLIQTSVINASKMYRKWFHEVEMYIKMYKLT